MKKALPPCGLYRTTKPLPDHEKDVPADVLVYFHNHSDSGLPVVVVAAIAVVISWRLAKRSARLAVEVTVVTAALVAATRLGWIAW